MIKDVYSVKNNNSKGTNCETRIRVRKLNAERAALTNNFIQIATPSAGYLIVDGNRYYMNYKNSIDFGDYAIIDTDELLFGKAYPFNANYKRDDDVVFADEAEMRALAQEQFDIRASLPQMKRSQDWNAETGVATVSFEFNIPDVEKVEEADNNMATQQEAEEKFEEEQETIINKISEVLEDAGNEMTPEQIRFEIRNSVKDFKTTCDIAKENGFELTPQQFDLVTAKDVYDYLRFDPVTTDYTLDEDEQEEFDKIFSEYLQA